MTTLKEFEEALREQGMHMALALLEKLRASDRAGRSVAPPRRVRGTKMTPELARRIVELHKTTEMTQQEIAFKLGVNQGRVNEVIKRGKWLTEDPGSPETVVRDRALARASARQRGTRTDGRRHGMVPQASRGRSPRVRGEQAQLPLGDV